MKKTVIVLIMLVMILTGVFLMSEQGQGKIRKSDKIENCINDFKTNVVSYAGKHDPDLRLEGISLGNFNYKVWLTEDFGVMASESFLEDVIGCSINQYSNGRFTIQRGEVLITIDRASYEANVNGEKRILKSDILVDSDGEIYFPISELVDSLDYEAKYIISDNAINFVKTGVNNSIPRAYDMRKTDRVTDVRDQGKYGTCWAFASLGALETTLMPLEKLQFSTDNMALNNSYNLDLSQGGEHTMSIAYMAAWQGPVLEKDDPYGDGLTNTMAKPAKHLQEAIVINDRDDEVIKGAIFKYGGVETSLYLHLSYGTNKSEYYDADTASYYYNGEETPNHDVVVVGWDDDYPKERFKVQPQHDGAYICKNSWGEEFGEGGYFYVSYEDKNLCQQSIVYSKLADADDFDKIYQSDLLGWVGQMGFGSETAYFANVYSAGKNEELAAVAFYATGPETEFSVYLVPDYHDERSLSERIFLASGETRYAGYYTVKLEEPVRLKDMSKYAIVVHIDTPGSTKPVAIEYNVGERTSQVDISDGEGYMSLYGEAWHSAELTQDCNICLKAFTNYIGNSENDNNNLDDDATIERSEHDNQNVSYPQEDMDFIEIKKNNKEK